MDTLVGTFLFCFLVQMLPFMQSMQIKKIYDRNGDGDCNITDNTNLVAELYTRKQSSYSENRIFPYITLEDLRLDLIQRMRKLAIGQRPVALEGQSIDSRAFPDRP